MVVLVVAHPGLALHEMELAQGRGMFRFEQTRQQSRVKDDQRNTDTARPGGNRELVKVLWYQ